jgi:hypothetical protein
MPSRTDLMLSVCERISGRRLTRHPGAGRGPWCHHTEADGPQVSYCNCLKTRNVGSMGPGLRLRGWLIDYEAPVAAGVLPGVTQQQSIAGRSLMSRMGAPMPLWFGRKYANAGAIATDFEQCKTKRILLGPEHAADEPFLVLRHPITPSVLGNLEMVRRRYRLRRETRHVDLACLLFQCSLRARRYISRLP